MAIGERSITRKEHAREAAAFVAFGAVLTIYFAISEAPTAINMSMAEAYAWGQEFQFGYNEHPPFWAWVCGVWFHIFPRTTLSYDLLSAVNCVIGLWGAWRLIGRFVKGPEQLAATALLIATPFYTILGYGMNANIIFVSVWPWAMYFFVRSLETLRTRDAVWLGLTMGAALMSKYYAVFLWATCFFAALRDARRAKYFASPTPYVAFAVAVIVCLPHIYWLIVNNAPPLRYVEEISDLGFGAAVRNTLETFFGSLGQNLLAIGLVIYFAGLKPREALATARARLADARVQFIAILALAPLALSLLVCLTLQSKLVTPMLQGTFALVPLLTIELLGGQGVERLSRAAIRIAVAITVLLIPAAPVGALGWVWLSNNTKVAEPRRELAEAATRLWHEKTNLPLVYVGGSFAYGDSVAFYSPDHPHSFATLDYESRLWVTPEAIAKHGLMILCHAEDYWCLDATARLTTPAAQRVELQLSRAILGRTFPAYKYIVTIIPPR